MSRGSGARIFALRGPSVQVVLAAAHRITDAASFREVTRRGRRATSRTLVVHLVVGPEVGSTPRAGFVVSKAVGNAVVRNRVKRRLRHLVGARIGGWAPGSLVVVRATPAAAASSIRELGDDLDVCLARAGRLPATSVVAP